MHISTFNEPNANDSQELVITVVGNRLRYKWVPAHEELHVGDVSVNWICQNDTNWMGNLFYWMHVLFRRELLATGRRWETEVQSENLNRGKNGREGERRLFCFSFLRLKTFFKAQMVFRRWWSWRIECYFFAVSFKKNKYFTEPH